MDYKQGENREQLFMTSLNQLVPQESWVSLKNNPLSDSEKERICQLLPNTKVMFK